MKKLALSFSAVVCLIFTAQAQIEAPTTQQVANIEKNTTEVPAAVRTNNQELLSEAPVAVTTSFLNGEHNNLIIEEVRTDGITYVIIGKKEGKDAELTYNANGTLVTKNKN
jgi:hypothetical protein